MPRLNPPHQNPLLIAVTLALFALLTAILLNNRRTSHFSRIVLCYNGDRARELFTETPAETSAHIASEALALALSNPINNVADAYGAVCVPTDTNKHITTLARYERETARVEISTSFNPETVGDAVRVGRYLASLHASHHVGPYPPIKDIFGHAARIACPPYLNQAQAKAFLDALGKDMTRLRDLYYAEPETFKSAFPSLVYYESSELRDLGRSLFKLFVLEFPNQYQATAEKEAELKAEAREATAKGMGSFEEMLAIFQQAAAMKMYAAIAKTYYTMTTDSREPPLHSGRSGRAFPIKELLPSVTNYFDNTLMPGIEARLFNTVRIFDDKATGGAGVRVEPAPHY